MPFLTGFEGRKTQASFQTQARLQEEWAARHCPNRSRWVTRLGPPFSASAEWPEADDSYVKLSNSYSHPWRPTIAGFASPPFKPHPLSRTPPPAPDVYSTVQPAVPDFSARRPLRHKYGTPRPASPAAPVVSPTQPLRDVPAEDGPRWATPVGPARDPPPAAAAAASDSSPAITISISSPNSGPDKLGGLPEGEGSGDEGTPREDVGPQRWMQPIGANLSKEGTRKVPVSSLTLPTASAFSERQLTVVSELDGTVVTRKSSSASTSVTPVARARIPFEFRASMEPLVKLKSLNTNPLAPTPADAPRGAPKLVLPLAMLQGLPLLSANPTASKYSAAARLAAAKAADKRVVLKVEDFFRLCEAEELDRDTVLQLTEGELTEVMDALGYDCTHEDRGDIKAHLSVLRAELQQRLQQDAAAAGAVSPSSGGATDVASDGVDGGLQG